MNPPLWAALGLALLLSGLFHHGSALICYSCTSTLSSSTDESAQLALRIFLDSAYRLPPVNPLCNKEKDVEFKTVQTSQCAINDECVKILSTNKDIGFVIRGCKSKIYKTNIGISQNLPCSAQASPSLCFCEENLCNGAGALYSSPIIFVIFVCFGLAVSWEIKFWKF